MNNFRPSAWVHSAQTREDMGLQVGDKVLYRGFWGAGAAEPGTITHDDSLKNGQPVYHVLLDNGRAHWGYAGQFAKEEVG